MAPSGANQPAAPADTDFAQAFKDLIRGEQTASAMESKLTRLEQKIEELLASMEDGVNKANEGESAAATTEGNGTSKDTDIGN